MHTIGTYTFIHTDDKYRGYNYDDVIAIRIIKGDLYFLGWMENAEHYAIKIPRNYYQCKIERDDILEIVNNSDIEEDNVYDYIARYVSDKAMLYEWETDDNGDLLHKEDRDCFNSYERFLDIIKATSQDEVPHIILTTWDELTEYIDILRDGDYIFINDI